jgi:hypothetical protein
MLNSRGTSMSNPVDEYLESVEGFEKKAGPMDYAGRVMSGMRGAVGAEQMGELLMHGGIIAGVGGLMGAARQAYNAATKSRDFKAMLDVYPDLAQHQADNPKMFNQHYSSLRRLNPTFAADPVVAGSYMRQMSEFPHNAGNVLVQSVGAAPKLQGGGMKDLSTALEVATLARPPSEMDKMKVLEQRQKLELNKRNLERPVRRENEYEEES